MKIFMKFILVGLVLTVVITIATLLNREQVQLPARKEILVMSLKVQNASSNQTMELNQKRPGLSHEIIARIKKFVFFVGYARSGHSIIGALMDAHPHVVIAHEFSLFKNFGTLNKVPATEWRDNLYNSLYRKSVEDADKIRSDPVKGYTLRVDGLSQGVFEDYVEVIGDKSGGMTTIQYLKDKNGFLKNYKKLKEKVLVPLRIINVLRNPFDTIATHAIVKQENIHVFTKIKKQVDSKVDISNSTLYKTVEVIFPQFGAVAELVRDVFGRENVLEIHNCDLVADPKGTLQKIFHFLEVDTTEHYLEVCAEKVFKSVSRSRDLMEWTPEWREMVEQRMREFEMFNRYSFASD